MPLKDPICGMTVTDKSFYHLEHDGVKHYFCGNKCKARFATRLGHFHSAGAARAGTDATLPSPRKAPLRWWLLILLAVAGGVWIYSARV
jgi:YHS domain-containing protein